jgi:transposase
MLSFSGSLKVMVALEPCDMRKGFNGLHALVTERLGEDPRAGALFVFINRRHTRLKILCWDGTGLWVLTNMHAPQCALREFGESSLPAPSLVWAGIGGAGRCRR